MNVLMNEHTWMIMMMMMMVVDLCFVIDNPNDHIELINLSLNITS